MDNLYLILDTTNRDYQRLLDNLKSQVNRNFKPRLNKDGTKALIQVKKEYLARTENVRGQLVGFVLGFGNEDWASEQVKNREWVTEIENE